MEEMEAARAALPKPRAQGRGRAACAAPQRPGSNKPHVLSTKPCPGPRLVPKRESRFPASPPKSGGTEATPMSHHRHVSARLLSLPASRPRADSSRGARGFGSSCC